MNDGGARSDEVRGNGLISRWIKQATDSLITEIIMRCRPKPEEAETGNDDLRKTGQQVKATGPKALSNAATLKEDTASWKIVHVWGGGYSKATAHVISLQLPLTDRLSC